MNKIYAKFQTCWRFTGLALCFICY